MRGWVCTGIAIGVNIGLSISFWMVIHGVDVGYGRLVLGSGFCLILAVYSREAFLCYIWLWDQDVCLKARVEGKHANQTIHQRNNTVHELSLIHT